MTVEKKRVAYTQAGRTGREAIQRALEADVSKTGLRVLLAVLSLTALYSKLEDEISIGQLMDCAGLSKSSVTDGLAELRAKRVIGRDKSQGGRDSKGRGYSGKISLLSDVEASVRTEGTLKSPSNPGLVSGKSQSKCPVQGDTPRSTREENHRGESNKFSPGVDPPLAAPQRAKVGSGYSPAPPMVVTAKQGKPVDMFAAYEAMGLPTDGLERAVSNSSTREDGQ